jgi:hypothetical protein
MWGCGFSCSSLHFKKSIAELMPQDCSDVSAKAVRPTKRLLDGRDAKSSSQHSVQIQLSGDQ